MRIVLVASLFMLSSLTTVAQITTEDISKAFNGIQDGRESGVDCSDNIQGYQPCNGNASITFNTKKYSTGVVRVQNNTSGNATRNQENSLSLNCYFFSGTAQKGIVLNLGPFVYYSMNPMKTKLKARSIKDYPVAGMKLVSPSASLAYLATGTSVGFDKIDKSTFFEITQVDKVERLISGNFLIKGVTDDGTPVDITGTFEKVSY